MEVFCSFTRFPQPIAALEEPQTPFPDIPGSLFMDMSEILKRAAKKLDAPTRALFTSSYLRIFGDGDVRLPRSDDEPAAACFSPNAARDIVSQASELPSDTLRGAVSKCTKSEYFEGFESVDDFLAVLDDIRATFQRAADENLGILIVMA